MSLDPIASEITPRDLSNWVLAEMIREADASYFTWQYAGDQSLDDPLYNLTLERLARLYPDRPRIRTTYETVTAFAALPNASQPSGFVFHMGQCGASVVSSALRCVEGTICVSEPLPLANLLQPYVESNPAYSREAYERRWSDLIRGCVAVLGRQCTGDERRFYVQFTDWNVLEIGFVKRLWPDVPCLFVYRDPVEVLVSHLKAATHWILFRVIHATCLRMDPDHVRTMRLEEYCAEIIGLFCKIVAESVDHSTALLNHSDFNVDSLIDALTVLGVDSAEVDRDRVALALTSYAGNTDFAAALVADAKSKREAASDVVIEMVKKHARAPYVALENLKHLNGMTVPATM